MYSITSLQIKNFGTYRRLRSQMEYEKAENYQ